MATSRSNHFIGELKWRLPALQKHVTITDVRSRKRDDLDLDYQSYYYPNTMDLSRHNIEQIETPKSRDNNSLTQLSNKLPSKPRTIDVRTNRRVYLEYINIIGNLSIVEKYLRPTVHLKPIEKQRKERQVKEVEEALEEKLIKLEFVYPNKTSKELEAEHSSKTYANLENQKNVDNVSEIKSTKLNLEESSEGEIDKILSQQNQLDSVTISKKYRNNVKKSEKPLEQLTKRRRKKLPKPIKQKESKIVEFKPFIKQSSQLAETVDNFDYEYMYNQIDEIDTSLPSEDEDNEAINDNANVKSEDNLDNCILRRPKAAIFERRFLSAIDDVEKYDRASEFSVQKRIKTFQKRLDSGLVDMVIDEEDEIISDFEPEMNQDVNVPDHKRDASSPTKFDSSFDFKFKFGFLKPRQKSSKPIVKELLVIQQENKEAANKEEVANLESSPTISEQKSEIDFSYFKFFAPPKRVRIQEPSNLEPEEIADDNDDEYYIGDDWLLKWYILKDRMERQCERIFADYDPAKKGYLVGEQLLRAIERISFLTNLKMTYLFSVLKLCEADPLAYGADLKLFALIVALANRIKYLDDDWFNNMLPNLDLSTVENKVFKVKNLWSILADSSTKTINIDDLMIEFEAGGVTREHLDFAREKFSNKSKFDLLDYLSYIPLFIFIHDRIVTNPLDERKDL